MSSDALYELNLSAKRIKKVLQKSAANSGKCSRNKLEEKMKQLYDLKRDILLKAVEQNHAKALGIHSKTNEVGSKKYFIYYHFGCHRFHLPVDQGNTTDLPFLGEYVCRKYVIKSEPKKIKNPKSTLTNWLWSETE